MPSAIHPPNLETAIARMAARIESLERTTGPVAPTQRERMVFSWSGTLSAGSESPPWYPSRGGSIQLIRLGFLVATTGTNTIEIRVNGVAQVDVSNTIGHTTDMFTGNYTVAPMSYVTVKTIAVADANLTVTLDLG
jgi:hypothetical protein